MVDAAEEPSLGEVRASVVAHLRARRGELEQAIFARVRDGVADGLGGEDAEYSGGLRAAVVAVVDYALAGLEQGEGWSGVVPPAAVVQAQRAARSGVSLDTVLRRYVIGHTLLEDFVMEETDRSGFAGRHGALRGVLGAQASLLDGLMGAVASEYMRELERVRSSPEWRRWEAVQRLLTGGHVDTIELGYDLDGEHLGAIVTGPGANGAVQALAVSLKDRFLSVSRSEESVWVWLAGRPGLAPADVQRLVSCKWPEGVSLVVGEPAAGVEGWRLTHRQAQAALRVALRRPRRLTRYADVVLLALALQDEALAESLIAIFLAPLASENRSGVVLRHTLRAYLNAQRNTSSTAAALGVARQTVENRLRIIEQKLGRQLQTCLPEIETALRLEDLNPDLNAHKPKSEE